MIRWQSLMMLCCCILCLSWEGRAQTTDTLPAVVHAAQDQNRVAFSGELRPLRGVAGAPAPFYSYFWELGDGSFSFEATPEHIYKDTGTYQIRLYATNNYDDGRPPPTKPRPIKIKNKSYPIAAKPSGFFQEGANIEMKANRMPRPGEEMMLVIGYRQPAHTKTGGSLLLLYNEKEFKQNNFNLGEARAYHQEKAVPTDSLWAYLPATDLPEEIPDGPLLARGPAVNSPVAIAPTVRNQQLKAMLLQRMSMFRKNHAWRLEGTQAGAEQFMFVSLQTTPEMIKDTNAVVNITALFMPDDPSLEPEEYTMELQIVASHDPNRILLRHHRMNYRFTGKKKLLNYKIQFQNTGKGPAKKVDIGVRVPGMLDGNSISLVDMQPKCIPCDSAYENQSCLDTVITKDSVHFVFRNIYLPGVQQEGVTDTDSTKGFIKYSIHFAKKPAKVPFTSQAAIVFDKNEPVITNRSVGRFKPGLSPGIILGYGSRIGDAGKWRAGSKNLTIGASIAPFAPHRKYLQMELYAGVFNESERFIERRRGGDTVINGRDYKVSYRDAFERVSIITLEAVPLQLRYNLNSWIGAGAGMLAAINLSSRTKNILITETSATANGIPGISLEGEQGRKTTYFTGFNPAVFADLQLGRVRTGPAAGFRYLYYMHPAEQRLFVYVTWRI
jgi:PKD repeat protein